MKLETDKPRRARSNGREAPDHHLRGALITIAALLVAFLALAVLKLHGG